MTPLNLAEARFTRGIDINVTSGFILAPMFTVKQLSEIAGVTPRTLRFYDRIELLKPSRCGRERLPLLRSRQRCCDCSRSCSTASWTCRSSASVIILARSAFDIEAALENHKAELAQRRERLEHLIETVDDTILHLKGKKEMSDKQLFAAFSEEEQAEMEKEAMQLYDPEIVRESNRKFKALTPAEKQAIFDEGNALYLALVATIPQGPDSPAAQAGCRTLAPPHGPFLDALPGAIGGAGGPLQPGAQVQGQLRQDRPAPGRVHGARRCESMLNG